jgi:hypothetical protein
VVDVIVVATGVVSSVVVGAASVTIATVVIGSGGNIVVGDDWSLEIYFMDFASVHFTRVILYVMMLHRCNKPIIIIIIQ